MFRKRITPKMMVELTRYLREKYLIET